MKYYIAGPIDTAGQKQLNIAMFMKAAAHLRACGYEVVSCIEGDKGDETYGELIKKDIKMLVDCDALVLLPGWPQSKGARGELAIAMYLNMPIHYFNCHIIDELINMNF